MATSKTARVVLTDHPWTDLDLERAIIEGAGFELVAGPVSAPAANRVEELVASADPQAILTCWAKVSRTAIASPRDLRIVARLGVGIDNIDVEAATLRGAWVTNVPDYCVTEVADHAVGLVLACERGIVRLDRDVRSNGWHVPSFVPRRIGALVIGLIGYGRIGRASAARFQALGCRVIAADPFAAPSAGGAQIVPLTQLQDEADVIVLHVPLTEHTHRMVDRAFIAACRGKPLIVNVSRGGLVNNHALEAALDEGLLRGAALDVIDGEPEPPPSLLQREDVIVTPHVAYLSGEALLELRRSACEEVVRVLRGDAPKHPRNTPARLATSVAAGTTAPNVGVALPGGVSSDIRLVQGPDGPIVVKTALGRLKVAAEWLSDPARSMTEVAALQAAARLIGEQAVPRLVWWHPEDHSFAMRPVDVRLRNWKQDLLAGRIDPATARQAGFLLARLHRRSMDEPELAEVFASRTFFHELRIEPFFNRVASRLPHLSHAIRRIVAAMENNRIALVHGDYSPKNILADGADIVILDFEVTHWGDPRFDVAFCLAHLLLKGARREADSAAFRLAREMFLDGYAAAAGPAPDDADLVALIGCLVMARLRGDSPVDYQGDIDEDAVRLLAEAMILQPCASARLGMAPFDPDFTDLVIAGKFAR